MDAQWIPVTASSIKDQLTHVLSGKEEALGDDLDADGPLLTARQLAGAPQHRVG